MKEKNNNVADVTNQIDMKATLKNKPT